MLMLTYCLPSVAVPLSPKYSACLGGLANPGREGSSPCSKTPHVYAEIDPRVTPFDRLETARLWLAGWTLPSAQESGPTGRTFGLAPDTM